MKVAIASMDGTTISSHFGRSACFLVYDIKDGNVTHREIRTNRATRHAQGECDSGRHSHDHGHTAILETLSDCDAVLCYGMGVRAAQDLESAGIKAYLLGAECTPDEAIAQFIAGTLSTTKGFCRNHG